jgi:hypothetical protein
MNAQTGDVRNLKVLAIDFAEGRSVTFGVKSEFRVYSPVVSEMPLYVKDGKYICQGVYCFMKFDANGNRPGDKSKPVRLKIDDSNFDEVLISEFVWESGSEETILGMTTFLSGIIIQKLQADDTVKFRVFYGGQEIAEQSVRVRVSK